MATAYDAAGICNIALSRIGITAKIETLTENTDEGRACNVLYPHLLRTLLESYDWPWARKRISLALLAAATEKDEWAFTYGLPTDCLLVRGILTGDERYEKQLPSQREEYEIGNELATKVLYTNQEDAEIVYTFLHEVPELYPGYFADALAWALAADLAMSLAIEQRFEVGARKRADDALAKAKALAAHEPELGEEPESTIITVRGS